MKKMSRTARLIQEMGHEVKHNPPAIVKHTARKFGKARAAKQRVAIMLSKARKAGADIPAK